MATQTFAPISGYNKAKWATNRLTLDGTGTITDTYVATTDDADCVGYDYVVFHFTYTTGAESTIQVRPEGYNGTDWVAMTYKAAQGTGVSELTKDIIQITKANYSTGDKFSTPQLSCHGFQKIRCSRKGVSGSTFGTLPIYATAGILDSKE